MIGASPAPSHEVMEQAAEWYALLISDEAREPDRRRWQLWIEASPQHRQAWRYVEQVSQRVMLPLKDLPDRRQAADNLHSANLRLLRRRRILAGVTILAGGGLLGSLAWRQPALRSHVLAWCADHGTAVGEIREVLLGDGTSVWLNTASAFDQDFRTDLRRLHLRSGEILITTAADRHRPFVVDTSQGRLRALGTRFTVRQEDNQTFLAVYQGAVELRTADTQVTAIIPAGRQTRFTTTAILPTAAADPARAAWSKGNLLALDLSIEEVVTELRRYTSSHIGVAPEVAARRVFGTFPLNNMDDTLALLAAAGNVKVRRRWPWWITLEAAEKAAP